MDAELLEVIARIAKHFPGTSVRRDKYMSEWKEVRAAGIRSKAFLEDGFEVVGTYLGGEEVQGKFGPSLHHHFTTDDGDRTIYGFGSLDHSLEGIPAGSMCKIVGAGTYESNGIECVRVNVFVKEDDASV